jgi:hypothetical protein
MLSHKLYTSRCSSGAEHFLGKEEVVSSILINGSAVVCIPQSGKGRLAAVLPKKKIKVF